MNRALLRKETMGLVRDTTLKVLAVAISILIIASIAAGLQRSQVFEKERTAAEATDREVWMGQGERNPHSAAHFSRYAFRPAAPLAMIDPGISDFAGVAVWMEAHYQDPAVFRRAEDGGELSRFTTLSPAFLLLIAAPLLILLLLHGSVAGEREDGTLRQLLATGVSPRDFLLGKLLAGWKITALGFLAVFAVVAAVSMYGAPPESRGDSLLRLAAMCATYGVYLSGFAAFAVGVSALFQSRQRAFLVLIGSWVVLGILLPRFASDISVVLFPHPDARETTDRLNLVSSAYWNDEELQQQVQARVLAEYGVDDVAELPINWGGYSLQYSEELSNPLFDELYAEIDRTYENQERVTGLFSLLSPTIAAARLSAGLAGTDRHHHRDFTAAAEAHRRAMVKLLNDDYAMNAGAAGSAYMSDETLWTQFEDFEFRPPPITSAASRYLPELGLLLYWLILTTAFAAWSTKRAISSEALTR